MQLSNSTLTTIKAAARSPRLRWWQLSLRTLLALVTLAAVTAFFHEPISAWADQTWRAVVSRPGSAATPTACGSSALSRLRHGVGGIAP